MTTSYLMARTIDVRRMVHPATPSGEVVAMTALLRAVAHTTIGKRMLEVALAQELQLAFASRWTLWYPGRGIAGAQYVPGKLVIRIGRQLSPSDQLVAMAHELQHFCDEALGWGTGWTIESEVRAEQSAALLAMELGLRAEIHGFDGRDALAAGRDIAASLRSSRMYADFPHEPPRSDGRVHPLASLDELRPGRRARPFSIMAQPVLVAGPIEERIAQPTDTAWCAHPVEYGRCI